MTDLTHLDPVITGHRTPGGKLAVKATSGDLSTTKYIVGGYHYYVLSARVYKSRWDSRARDMVDEPNVAIWIHKRTDSRDTALRAASRTGGTAYRVTDGKLVPIGSGR
jgi:hypothetical protein